MKRILIITCFAAFAINSNAQNNVTPVTTSNDTMGSTKTLEEKVAKQEQELEALKKDNHSLKKEMKQIRSSSFFRNTNKISISRRGSKQIVSE